jgi:tRNA threonylcarbamoyladenosine biosynthesis protein TsaB
VVILALDTATPAPSLAVLRGEDLIGERTLDPEVGAGRRIAEELHRLLSDTATSIRTVEQIVVGVGPGGFTGLRIGIATSLGLGQALGVPVVGVSSLETLALGAGLRRDELVAPVIDAKRNELFAAVYRVGPDSTLDEVVAPAALSADAVAIAARALGAPVVLVGDGLPRLGDQLGDGLIAHPDSQAHRIRAALGARRAGAGGARPVTPVYLRLPDAEVNRRAREEAAA